MAKILPILASATVLLVGSMIQPAFGKPTGARIVYDSTMNNDGKTVRMQTTYFIQDGAVRFETDMPKGADVTQGAPREGPAGKMIMIANPKAKKYVLLMEAQKMYMEMPEPTQKQAATVPKGDVPFKATGKTKTIAGYSCDVFERTVEGRQEEACASKDLNDVFAELEKSMPKAKGDMSSLPGGLTGFPMEYQVKTGKSGGSQVAEIEMHVTEVKRENIASAKFEVPKDYQKQPMPTFDMMPNAPAASKKAPARKPHR